MPLIPTLAMLIRMIEPFDGPAIRFYEYPFLKLGPIDFSGLAGGFPGDCLFD